MTSSESFMTEVYDEGVVSEVIRPAAIIPEEAARAILVELALSDALNAGVWLASPTSWNRYDRPWHGADNPAGAELIGTIHVAYGMPSRYEITVFRVTVTRFGTELGWTVENLCDEALAAGGLTLADCPRADLQPPPKPFRM
ncbi:MAG: hypothetical protein M0Z98_07200 [Actinomycetales bacterium]|nr:hypothetical protein [Actinomycetales bacterium]